RRWKKHDAGRQVERLRIERERYVLRRFGAQRRPELRGLQGIVVSRQDDPADRRVMTHLRQRLSPHLRGRGLGVKGIARQKDRRGISGPRMPGKFADRCMPRLPQLCWQVARELTETLAQMQVARMNESKAHQAFLLC